MRKNATQITRPFRYLTEQDGTRFLDVDAALERFRLEPDGQLEECLARIKAKGADAEAVACRLLSVTRVALRIPPGTSDGRVVQVLTEFIDFLKKQP